MARIMPLSDNGDLKVTIDLDELTIGDLERLDSNNITQILQVFDHVVSVEGCEVRDLHFSAIKIIAEVLRDTIQAETNPVASGKN
jgi:hypothetical protein